MAPLPHFRGKALNEINVTTEAKTAEECAGECVQESACAGFSFNGNRSLCRRFSSNKELVATNADARSWEHYTKQRCPTCLGGWRNNFQAPISHYRGKVANQLDGNTAGQEASHTAEECALECAYEAACAGFSFNGIGQTCRHYNRTKEGTPTSNVTQAWEHYWRQACPTLTDFNFRETFKQ